MTASLRPVEPLKIFGERLNWSDKEVSRKLLKIRALIWCWSESCIHSKVYCSKSVKRTPFVPMWTSRLTISSVLARFPWRYSQAYHLQRLLLSRLALESLVISFNVVMPGPVEGLWSFLALCLAVLINVHFAPPITFGHLLITMVSHNSE